MNAREIIPKKQIHSFHCSFENLCWIPVACWINAKPVSRALMVLDILASIAFLAIPSTWHMLQEHFTSPTVQIHRTFYPSECMLLATPGLLCVWYLFYLKNFSFCKTQLKYLHSNSTKKDSHLSLYFPNSLTHIWEHSLPFIVIIVISLSP